MRMVVLIGSDDPCFLSLFASRIHLHRPIGILSDLCTIIERAMYTDNQSGNNNPNVFGSWPPYRGLFYESGQLSDLVVGWKRVSMLFGVIKYYSCWNSWQSWWPWRWHCRLYRNPCILACPFHEACDVTLISPPPVLPQIPFHCLYTLYPFGNLRYWEISIYTDQSLRGCVDPLHTNGCSLHFQTGSHALRTVI